MAFKTPVLLIAYRRPDTTKQVIDAIRVAAPERIFVACDGPNLKNPGEAEKVAATRALIEREIDWPCKIERRYSDTNQGCKMGPSSAITWFFEQVEEGIILEDDCVAHPDFFPYCEALLERYNNDRRVWCISGDNSAAINLTGDWSYGFIHTPLVWGWASWRRAWANYDIQMNVWNKIKNTPILQDIRNVLRMGTEKESEQEILCELFFDYKSDFYSIIKRRCANMAMRFTHYLSRYVFNKKENYSFRKRNQLKNPYNIKWDYLPVTFFSPCTRLNGKLWEPGMDIEVPENIIMHHANGTIGIENKIAQLKYVKNIRIRNA